MKTVHSHITPRDLGIALGVVVLWALHFVIIRIGALEIPPLLLLVLRFSAVLLLFSPFVKRVSVPQIKALILYGFPHFVGHLSALFVGLKYLESSLAGLIIQMELPFIILLGWVVYKEKFGIKTAVGLVIALCGVVMIVYQPFSPDFSYLGSFLILASAFFWSVGTLRMRYIHGVDFASMTFYSHLAAYPFLVLMTTVFEDNHWQAFQQADLVTVGGVLFYQVFLMSGCLYIWRGLIQRNLAYKLTTITLLQPVLIVLFSMMILGETLAWNEAVGGLVTLIGVGIVAFRKARKKQQLA